MWKAVDPGVNNFTTGSPDTYSSWNFGLDQQVMLSPDSSNGIQLVVNSLDGLVSSSLTSLISKYSLPTGWSTHGIYMV